MLYGVAALAIILTFSPILKVVVAVPSSLAV